MNTVQAADKGAAFVIGLKAVSMSAAVKRFVGADHLRRDPGAALPRTVSGSTFFNNLIKGSVNFKAPLLLFQFPHSSVGNMELLYVYDSSCGR